ncbi:MAG TPA: CHRD domain-containing protein [Thermoanaerobaculia bacterium]|nr:CHRD domain-containing protein [Thermoanaerobaculia bacterium]
MRKLTILVFALLAISASAFAQTFSAPLTGAAVFPGPGDTDGTGVAVISINGTSLNYTFLGQNLGTVTAIQLLDAATGATGAPILTIQPTIIAGSAFGTISNVSQDVINRILANPSRVAVNVVTSDFANGSVRGQLVAPTIAGGAASTLFLPNTAKVAGANNTNFVTDVRIVNRTSRAANVTLDFFASSGAGQTAPTSTRTIVVAPGEQKILDDVLGATLTASGLGALRISSDQVIEVSSRVINDLRSVGLGTLGSAVDGLTLEEAKTSATLSFLSQFTAADQATGVGFRTNIGFFNPGSTPATITFTARRTTDGSVLGTNTVTVPGLSQQQASAFSLLSNVPVADQSQANFYVTYTSSAPVFVYAAVIDNKSGDSVIIQ